jgi:ribosomal protein L29
MEIKEFRELSPKDLDQKIADLKQQLFELRRKKAVGQLEHAEQVRSCPQGHRQSRNHQTPARASNPAA